MSSLPSTSVPPPELSLDERIRRAELRLIAREDRIRRRTDQIGRRLHDALEPRRYVAPAAGIAVASWLVWTLLSRSRRRPVAAQAAAAHAATVPRLGSELPWMHLLPLVWPLLPLAWRARVNPATAATLLSLGLPLLELVALAGQLVLHGVAAAVGQLDAQRHRTRPAEQLHRIVLPAARALRHRDAHVGHVAVEQVAPVRRRLHPAVEQAPREVGRLEAARARRERDVLGGEAVRIAGGLRALGRLAAVGVVAVAVGVGHVACVACRCGGETRLGLERFPARLRAQFIGTLQEQARHVVVEVRRGAERGARDERDEAGSQRAAAKRGCNHRSTVAPWPRARPRRGLQRDAGSCAAVGTNLAAACVHPRTSDSTPFSTHHAHQRIVDARSATHARRPEPRGLMGRARGAGGRELADLPCDASAPHGRAAERQA
jgi:hypothetical protein